MGWLGPALNFAGGAIGGITSLIAGNSQANAAKEAAQQGNALLTTAGNTARADLSPYRDAGAAGVGALQKSVLNPQQFTMSDFYNDPGYQFQLQQGNQAIERSAAARGGLTSGATGKALAGYTTNLANTTYGDAYNRYLQTRQQGNNELMGLANIGLGATNSTVGAGLNVAGQQANNLTSAITGAGAARASGYVGAANAVNGSLSDYYLMNQLKQGGGIARPTLGTPTGYNTGGHE
jgi:hypothetical protein